MRDAAIADRFAGLGLTERDEIVRARRADEDHVFALAEANLQTKCSEIEALRALKIADVQIDVVQSQRGDHRCAPGYSAASARCGAACSTSGPTCDSNFLKFSWNMATSFLACAS